MANTGARSLVAPGDPGEAGRRAASYEPSAVSSRIAIGIYRALGHRAV
jgi:hypothetical protein